MATLRVNDQDLEFPDGASITLDEAMVVWDYSKITLDELEELEGLPSPVLAALIHIAVQRANPDMKAADIKKSVRAMKMVELLDSVTEEEDEAVEPDLPPPNSNSSSAGSDPSEPSSGAGGEQNSASRPDESLPPPTGTPGSDSSLSRLTGSVA